MTGIQEVRHSFPDFAVQKAALGCAKEKAEQMFARSKMVDFIDSYPKFTISQMKLGRKLGKGNFGIVYECHEFDATERNLSSSTSTHSLRSYASGNTIPLLYDEEGRSIISNYEYPSFTHRFLTTSFIQKAKEEDSVKSRSLLCFRRGGDSKYALKMLQEEVVRDPAMLYRASIDMALESRMLSSMNHPNIINMHACGARSPYVANYFIVVDRLYDTLEKRIEKWEKKQKYISNRLGRVILDPRRKKSIKILEDKLMTALDLAAAFEYLHSNNIVFRDLKPDNVGFDLHDDVKLFDFGLSKEVHEEDRDADGLYNLTSMTGSPLYMAPEVALGHPYTFSCDMYSFAMLFWQIYTCKEPFLLYRMSDMKERVWSGELTRPKVKESWSLAIVGFLHAAWSHDLRQRPSFQQVYKTLEEECVRVIDEYDTGVELLQLSSTH